jgi:hypothetical protein
MEPDRTYELDAIARFLSSREQATYIDNPDDILHFASLFSAPHPDEITREGFYRNRGILVFHYHYIYGIMELVYSIKSGFTFKRDYVPSGLGSYTGEL